MKWFDHRLAGLLRAVVGLKSFLVEDYLEDFLENVLEIFWLKLSNQKVFKENFRCLPRSGRAAGLIGKYKVHSFWVPGGLSLPIPSQLPTFLGFPTKPFSITFSNFYKMQISKKMKKCFLFSKLYWKWVETNIKSSPFA